MTVRPDPTVEAEMALLAHQADHTVTVYALNNAGHIMPDIIPHTINQTTAGIEVGHEVHMMVERIVRDGSDPDVDGLIFFWRLPGDIPPGVDVAVVVVSRTGEALERDYTFPVRAGQVVPTQGGFVRMDTLFCYVAGAATRTAFGMAGITGGAS